MPNAVTLMSEYAPQRKRSMIVNTMFCGFTLGSALGGFVAAWMIPRYGWHSMFIVGGCLPLLLAMLLLQLPESPRFMVVRRWPDKKIADVLNRIAPGSITSGAQFTVPELVALAGKTALAVIFSARYRFGTLMLWLTYFMGLLIFYLLTSWMPTLIKNAGFSISQASNITALFPLGGVIGTLAVGWLMDRMSAHKAIAITYVLTGIFVYAIGHGTGDAVLLGVLMFVAGLCMNGAQSSMPALAAGFYPTQGRATGVAWMLGIGRLGGILGAAIGGQLLQFGWGLSAIFSLLALPAFVAAAALLFKHLHLRSHGQLSMSS
jgi:AAHS family 4-hydroxybenzoate transporter-like MFS transporter